jgi:hypothetical protein
MARHLGHEGFGVEPAGLGEPLEGVAHEGEHALALAPLDPMLERQREDGLDPDEQPAIIEMVPWARWW